MGSDSTRHLKSAPLSRLRLGAEALCRARASAAEANFPRFFGGCDRAGAAARKEAKAAATKRGHLAGGCDRQSASGPVAGAPVARAPVTTQATQPSLKEVDLRHGVYLARIEIHTTITPGGQLRSVRTEGKSYGPRDIDPKLERRDVRQGQLTPEQMAELAALFTGWESLSSLPYGGVPDGGHTELRYGDKIVSGGSDVPKQKRAKISPSRSSALTRPVIVPSASCARRNSSAKNSHCTS